MIDMLEEETTRLGSRRAKQTLVLMICMSLGLTACVIASEVARSGVEYDKPFGPMEGLRKYQQDTGQTEVHADNSAATSYNGGMGQCAWFVKAVRIDLPSGKIFKETSGDAWEWYGYFSKSLGWRSGDTPKPGAIMCFGRFKVKDRNGKLVVVPGHVAVVRAVNDVGTIDVWDSNHLGDGKVRKRTIKLDPPPAYLQGYLYAAKSDTPPVVWSSSADDHETKSVSSGYPSSFTFVRSWSVFDGNAVGENNGLAIDPSGNVYVAANNSVRKFDSAGRSLGYFMKPLLQGVFDIDIDERGSVYVLSGVSRTVHQLTSDGQHVRQWDLPKLVGTWHFDAQSASLGCGAGALYVADDTNVIKLTDDGNYTCINPVKNGRDGTLTQVQLGKSAGWVYDNLALGQDGSLFVLTDRFGVLTFDTDGGYRSCIKVARHPGYGSRYRCGFAVGRDGCIYVVGQSGSKDEKSTDSQHYFGPDLEIKVYAPDGKPLCHFGGSGPGRLVHPGDVAVDGQGRVYVLDSSNHRVVEFAPIRK